MLHPSTYVIVVAFVLACRRVATGSATSHSDYSSAVSAAPAASDISSVALVPQSVAAALRVAAAGGQQDLEAPPRSCRILYGDSEKM